METSLAEDELDVLVSIAIRRAELLEEIEASTASAAWYEVMAYEERIAGVTSPSDIPGGIARVGAVRAALSAGRRRDASRLATQYLAEKGLPAERRASIERVLEAEEERLATRFPGLAKRGRLRELDAWRAVMSHIPHVFPLPA